MVINTNLIKIRNDQIKHPKAPLRKSCITEIERQYRRFIATLRQPFDSNPTRGQEAEKRNPKRELRT